MTAALHQMHTLPELVFHQHALLWSINERLAGKPGLEIPPLGENWAHDLVEFESLVNEEMTDWREKLRSGEQF